MKSLADDLDISPDFFEYFSATYPVLKHDPDLWCVSAWNDNGKQGMVSSEAGTVSLGFFCGDGGDILNGLGVEGWVRGAKGDGHQS